MHVCVCVHECVCAVLTLAQVLNQSCMHIIINIYMHVRNTLREKTRPGMEHARLRGEKIPQMIIVTIDRIKKLFGLYS